MRPILFVVLYISCSAIEENFYRGESYSQIRIYEYIDYTDMTLLKFNIDYPSSLANWSLDIQLDGKCSKDLKLLHFHLQHQAYPLIAPRNESFPDLYITTRHNLISRVFNRTETNLLVQVNNPLKGTWFVLTFMERFPLNLNSKITTSNCNVSLTTWLEYKIQPVLLTLTINQPLQIILSNHNTSIYASFYTSIDNSRLTIQSDWSSICEINILIRFNGLPSLSLNDYAIVCKNISCSFEFDPIAPFLWIYFEISLVDISCLTMPISGFLTISAESQSDIQIYSTRRIKSNFYYDFLYIPDYSNHSTNIIHFRSENSSIYSYEILVDDGNLGGTLHLYFQANVKLNQSILGCLSKNRLVRHHTCESNFQIVLKSNLSTTISLPYPEIGLWYLTFESHSNNSLKFKIYSTKCTQDQCGTYGICQILTTQQNIFSACSCVAGFRGFGCTDDRYNRLDKYLPSVLFLTLSNLMFLPAIILAAYNRLYIEGLIYFFNMFFSTFYHACDQEIRRFCILKYDSLQFIDFMGSYSSFVITLLTMSLISRAKKIFLFILGILVCVVLNSRDRFDNIQFIGLISIIFLFTLISWIWVSKRKHQLQPTCREILFFIPGFILSLTGILLFAFGETDDNYWYVHSIWHISMAISILFFLPKTKKENEIQLEQSIGINNEGSELRDETERPEQMSL